MFIFGSIYLSTLYISIYSIYIYIYVYKLFYLSIYLSNLNHLYLFIYILYRSYGWFILVLINLNTGGRIFAHRVEFFSIAQFLVWPYIAAVIFLLFFLLFVIFFVIFYFFCYFLFFCYFKFFILFPFLWKRGEGGRCTHHFFDTSETI